MEAFLRDLPRRVKRDALRALRGRILRTELYALDGTERENHPYTVTEFLHGAREEAAPAAGEEGRLRIFFPHTLVQRTTQWERGEDPMTQFSFTADYDDFGQPRQQTTVALPRRQLYRRTVTGAVVGMLEGDEVNETHILTTHTRTEYATPDGDHYMHNRVAQVRTFELAMPPEVAEPDPTDLGRVMQEQRDAARGVHERFQGLFEEWTAGEPLPTDLKLIGHTLNYYDGEAYAGLPVGVVGQYGALTRSETLVFTDAELEAAYGERRPTYLGGTATLPPEAPAGFGDDLGYRRETASPAGYHDGYYADTQRQRFDFQREDGEPADQVRGLVLGVEDALGHRATITPDGYWLLPVTVTDPVGLTTTAVYDYRVLQPESVTDPNGNATHFRYTPQGLLDRQFLVGREGEGGTEAAPEVAFTYDFLAYARTRDEEQPQPIYVHTRRRIYHASDGESDETIESREYSDGFGRLVQTRTQAEELVFGETGDDVGLPLEPGNEPEPAVGRRVADRVVVSGWQIYDNKGQVIEKYEPFFDAGWDYQPEAEAKQGQHVTMFYDPRGQVIRTVNPDGSEQRVIHGVPGTVAEPDLTTPDVFEPTPWQSYTYDANDLAPLTAYTPTEGAPEPLTDRAPAEHHYTPASTLLDALGRVICQVARNGGNEEEDWYITRSEYNVRGNLLKVTDTLGRPAFEYVYDLRNNPLRIQNIDAGRRTSVLDANGNLVEYRDSKGSVVLHRYDALNRLTELWARNNDEPDSRLTLRERLIYGDDGDRAAALAYNALGRLTTHYDEAGVQHFERYDFKGNLLDKTRRVISDAAIADGWIADWNAPDAEDALDATRYETGTRYDALNRAVTLVYPADVYGDRAVLTPTYNRAGALESVALDGQPYVTQIAYNAKGQRVLIAYGNGVMTRYAYDPLTFRLARLRSERYIDPAPPDDTWRGAGAPLQDFTYSYDLVGNITSIEERTPNCGTVGNGDRNRLRRQFTYDPLYRLTSGDGRACGNIRGVPRPLADLARCGAYTAPYTGGSPTPNQDNAPELTEYYKETYRYDPMGNMLELGYTAASGPWTRRFGMDGQPHEAWELAGNNQMTSLTQGSATHSFRYDDNGNMLGQNTERHYTWDHADRMIGFRNQPEGSSHASVDARYLYGADGMRVKKWVRKNDSTYGESMVYIDDVFEHFRNGRTGLTNNHLNVMDDRQRVALVRRGERHPDDAGPAVQFHLGDHLGSSGLVIDDDGTWVNREEFTPYGETSFGGVKRKRYRFTGKERDNESGLNYQGSRYYAPSLNRWMSCDPMTLSLDDSPETEGDHTRLEADRFRQYQYADDNPLRYTDPEGRTPTDAEDLVNATRGLRNALSGTPHGAALRGSSEAALAEAQGSNMFSSAGNVRSHVEDVRSGRNCIQNRLREIGNVFRNMRAAGNYRSVDQLARAYRPLLDLARQRLNLLNRVLALVEELQVSHSNRLAGRALEELGRTRHALASNQLVRQGLSLLPREIERQWSWTVQGMRQLPISFRQAAAQATAAVAAVRASLLSLSVRGAASSLWRHIGTFGTRLLNILSSPLLLVPRGLIEEYPNARDSDDEFYGPRA